MNTRWRQIERAREKWLYPALERKLREEAGISPSKQGMVAGTLLAMRFNDGMRYAAMNSKKIRKTRIRDWSKFLRELRTGSLVGR